MTAFILKPHIQRWYRAALSGGPGSLAAQDLQGETDGLALSFTDSFFLNSTSHYGSARVKDTSTPANNYNSHPFGLLTYAGASVKLCRGPSGTLRYGAHNLVTSSELIGATGSTGWSPLRATVTAGQDDPWGGATAVRLAEDSQTGAHRTEIFTVTVTASMAHTMAVVAKEDPNNPSQRFLYVRANDAAPTNLYCYFNLQTGVATADSGMTGEMIGLGDGWYLCKATITNAASSISGPLFGLATAANFSGVSYEGDNSSGIYLARAQLYRYPADDTYLKTTDAPRYELPYEWGPGLFDDPTSPTTQDITVVAGSWYTVTVEGAGSVSLTGAGKGTVTSSKSRTFKATSTTLSVTVSGAPDAVYVAEFLGIVRPEGQATNLNTRSSTALWVTQNLTETEVSSVIAGRTSDKLQNNNSTEARRVLANVSLSTSTTHCYSVIIENVDATKSRILVFSAGLSDWWASLDYAWGDATTTQPRGSNGTLSVEDLGLGPNGGELRRLILVFPAHDSNAVHHFYVYPAGEESNTLATIIHHAQIEAGSSATSPIETAGSTVTRAADVFGPPLASFPWNEGNGTYTVNGETETPADDGTILTLAAPAGHTHIETVKWVPSS